VLREPELTRQVLANGLRVVVAPQPHLHTAMISIFVRVGSRFEDERTNGISHFLEHMLYRGTARHPSGYELNRAIEELGATLCATTHPDFTVYQIRVPPESVDAGLQIFGEVLTTPAFTSIEAEKGIIRQEILEALDEDGRDVDVESISRELVFAPHPLAFKITGSAQNVARFELGDLRAHMSRYYGARNAVLSVGGAVDAPAVLESARRWLGGLAPGEPAERAGPPRAARRGGPRWRYVDSVGSQTDLRMCFPTFGEADPRRTQLALLSRVLDDGMSTPLYRRVCDDRGLAYEIFAGVELYEDCGIFDVGATVEHTRAPDLVRETLAVLSELRGELVGEAELGRAKRRYLWELDASLDEVEALSTFYGTMELFEVGETLATLAERVRAVTVEQIREVARETIQGERLHVACVGMLDEDVQTQTRNLVRAFR